MTLKDAKTLRDEIQQHYHCIVPLGFRPDRYFTRIYTSDGNGGLAPIDFHARPEYRMFRAKRLRDHRAKMRMYEAAERALSRPRSPIELMIDRACGLA